MRPRTSAPFDQLYVTISPVPTLMQLQNQIRGSARLSALRDQVTLQDPILRSHLQDAWEPRPTKRTSIRLIDAPKSLLEPRIPDRT